MTITEFLEARIAEDEAAADGLLGVSHSPRTQVYIGTEWVSSPLTSERLLAEAAAKRAIMALADHVEGMDYQITSEWGGDIDGTADDILKALAAVYADHPDYQQEWKP